MSDSHDKERYNSDLISNGYWASSNDDKRSQFRRDRDRVYFSDEFRRLEGVTQVASAVSGRVHNRMTHSFRVEQIARSIAIALDSDLVNEDVVSMASLAHDLGHPPFGHNGEKALQEMLICPKHRKADRDALKNGHGLDTTCDYDVPCLARDSFEGNAQTFHMIAALSAKQGNEKTVNQGHTVRVGLDLTRRSLKAVLKYPWVRGGNRSKPNKWSVYDAELPVFRWIFDNLETAGLPSLEAQVMDFSDDIAYAVHDIEDFFKLGVIPLWQIRDGSNDLFEFMMYLTDKAVGREGGELFELVEQYRRYFDYRKRMAEQDALDVNEDQENTYRESAFPFVVEIGKFCRSFPSERYEDSLESDERVSSFRSDLITEFVSDIEINDKGVLQYRSAATLMKIHFLKQLTWFYAIDNPRVQALKIGQRRIVQKCFTMLYSQARKRWVTQNDAGLDSLREVTPQDRHKVPPRLVSYYQINHGYYLAREYNDTRDLKLEPALQNQLMRTVIARSVIDYMCSLSDAALYELYDQLEGRLSERLVLDTYILN